MEDDRVDDAAEGGARGREPDRERQVRAEVGGQNGDAGDKQAAGADADAQRLREDRRPQRVAQREHHLTEHDEEGPRAQQVVHVAGVVDGAGQRADEEEQEGLQGADP